MKRKPPVAADEAAIKRACQTGDFVGATTAALGLYGAEVFGFLSTMHQGSTLADDSFSLFAERLWQKLPEFAWGCSLRTWAYLLARHASVDAFRREERFTHDASSSQIHEMAARIRTETISFLKSEKLTALRKLRDELPEEEKMLLILRVDRRMGWNEIARVLTDDEEAEALTRSAARLRKRFQLVRDRLRAKGKELGLT